MSGLSILRRSRRAWLSALALLFLVTPPARSAETNQASAPVVFHVGMAKVCFLDVNRNDAIAAFKVFLENSGRRIGKIYAADPQVYDDTSSFEVAIQQRGEREFGEKVSDAHAARSRFQNAGRPAGQADAQE